MEAAIPTHTLHLTPHFTHPEATHLSVQLMLTVPHAKAGDVLYYFETLCGNVPAHKYEATAIGASDAAGPLPLTIVPPPASNSSNHEEQWRAGRDTQGDIAIKLEVHPRAVDASTPIGPRVDLRRDGGGLIGTGRWFLPRPWHPTQKRYRFVMTWDLSGAPPGTRAVWSGGGECAPGQAAEVEGSADVFCSTVFMVGPIRSSPPPGAGPSPSATYWFGELPEYIDAIKDFSAALFPHAAAFFRSSDKSTFGVFIRKSIRGFGGTNFRNGYVLEYNDDAEPWSDCQLVNLLTHEMAHTWASLDNEDDGFQNLWFIEGVAQYYALYLPVRAGLRGLDYFHETLDAFLCSYYTNPQINMSLRQAQREFFDHFYSGSIPYMRGFVYLLLMDGLIRKCAKERGEGLTSLDSIVLDLMLRRRQGEWVQSKHWLEALYVLIGKERADKEFSGMIAGETIDLTPICSQNSVFGSQFRLRSVLQEVMDVGMDSSSSHTGVVTGLKAGSRAELSGLRNGDRIVRSSRPGEALSRFGTHFNYIVERNGEEIEGRFWPRSFDKTPSFQLAK